MQIRNRNKIRVIKMSTEPNSLIQKRNFQTLSNSQKSKVLKKQAEKLLNFYKNDEEWKEFQALDVKDD